MRSCRRSLSSGIGWLAESDSERSSRFNLRERAVPHDEDIESQLRVKGWQSVSVERRHG